MNSLNSGGRAVSVCAAALAIAACSVPGYSTVPGAAGRSTAQGDWVSQWQVSRHARRACPQAAPGHIQCEALVSNGNIDPALMGWGAPDIEAAYNLPSSTKGLGQIVAIVDAYDNPNVASDLAAYRSYYGLPPANFYKYNEDGKQGHYPPPNAGSGLEIDLDVEMVSASCPNCTIYLIEAKETTSAATVKAEREAVKLGAHIISNSFICYGFKGCNQSRGFETPGVTYVAAAGDKAYGIGSPMALSTVVSVGGTILTKSSSTYSEVVWPDTGGGCALEVPKPSWQHDSACSGRTANDVAAVAANMAEYDTYDYGGWILVHGTSVAAPIVAGAFALAGNGSKQIGGKIFWRLREERRANDLHVISSGTDGCPGSLSGSYLCTAGTGQFKTYSGPAGWGTPNGIGAF